MPQKFKLISANENYGIFFDEISALQYVKPRPVGAQKIIDLYRQKYDTNLHLLEIRSSQSAQDLQEKIKQIAKQLKEGQVVGVALLLMFKETSDIYHASPLILAKQDDKIVMIKFKDSKMDGFLAKKEIESIANRVKKIEQYSEIQSDDISCITITLNTLKNCLIEPKFMATISAEASCEMPKLTMSQKRVIWQDLSDEKKEKYIKFLEILGKDVSLKAFYKGHDYARKINPGHLDLLDEKTRKTVEAIDEVRANFKKAQESAGFELDDFELDDGDCNILDLLEESFLGTKDLKPTKTPPKRLDEGNSGVLQHGPQK